MTRALRKIALSLILCVFESPAERITLLASRVISYCALGLGIALLIIAVLSPFLLIPTLKVIPLDAGGPQTTQEAPGMLLDAQAFAANQPVEEHRDAPECAPSEGELPMSCFISSSTPLRLNRTMESKDPATKKFVTLQATTTLSRGDREAPDNVVSTAVDTVTLNRFSAEPDADLQSSFQIQAPDLGLNEDTGKFARVGLQYRFPFDTERRSYQFFDTTAQTDNLMDFSDAVKEHGTKSLQFEQNVGAVNMLNAVTDALRRDGDLSDNDRAALTDLQVTAPARRWYSADELAAQGISPDQQVSMTRYYSVARTVRVEPKTGIIVYGADRLNYFFARSDEEAQQVADAFFRSVDHGDAFTPSPQRTALFVDAAWDQDTQDRAWDSALAGFTALKNLEFAIYVVGTLGVLVIAVSMVFVRRSLHRQHHS